MLRKPSVLRRKASRHARLAARPAVPLTRRSLFERLEDRRVLDGTYFDTLADDVAGSQGALQTITSALQSVQSAVKLPLINQPLQQITQITTSLQEFQSNLASALHSLTPGAPDSAIQTVIFDAIGPAGANVLEPHSDGSLAVLSDVSVTTNPANGGFDVSLNLGYSTGKVDAPAGLGIPAIPFQPAADTKGGFVVEVNYQHFDFGYNPASGPYFGTDSNSQLQLTLDGDLPPTFNAGLGFMNVTVTQNPPPNPLPPNYNPHDVSVTLSSNVSGGIGNNEGSLGISDPTLSGELNLNKHVLVQVPVDGMPQLQGDLLLNWSLPNVGAGAPLAGWGAPTFALNNVQLEIGSVLGSLAKPIAKDVNAIIQPLKPIFDVLQDRIPGLSDLSELLGGQQVTLLSLDQELSSLPAGLLPPQLVDSLNSIVTMRNYANTIDDLASAASGWINVGSFNISSPGGSSLLTTAAAALGNLGLGNWTSLVTADGGVNFDGIKQEIIAALPAGVGSQVNSLFDSLSGSADGGGMQFTYPIITDPASVALGLFLGQDADMVTFSDQLTLPFDESFDIDIIPGFFIHVTAVANVDAFIGVGYDTRGLRDAIAPLYGGGSFDTSKLLDGLYIDKTTHADVNADLEAGPGVGLDTDVLKLDFRVTGGLTGSLHMNIDNPTGDPKIRPFAGGLTNQLFDVSGSLNAVLDATLQAGVNLPDPIGFVGFDKTWDFVSVPLYQFTTTTLPIPPELIPPVSQPVSLFTYDSTTHTLTLNAGLTANLRGPNGFPDAHDETFTIDHDYYFFLIVPSNNPNVPPKRVYFSRYTISGMGFTQTFDGEVDNIDADMGDGKDSLTVIDQFSPTVYTLNGGTGDDTISVEGNVQVHISGGDGNDTIQAGNGSTDPNAPSSVDGGTGTDTITFGGGDLANVNPGVFTIARSPDDMSIDSLIFDNSRSRVDTQYEFIKGNPANPFQSAYTLGILDDEGNGPIERDFRMSQYDVATIYSGSGNDQFLGAPPLNSKLYGGDGDDTLDLNYLSPGTLPAGPLVTDPVSFHITYPQMTFIGGKGNDSVLADDSASPGPGSYLLSQVTTNNASSLMQWRDGTTEGNQLLLGGVENMHLTAPQQRPIQVNSWSQGNLYLQGGAVDMDADDSMLWSVNVVIRNTPIINLSDSDGATGLSAAGINAQGPYIRLPGNNKVQLNVDSTAQFFNFFVNYGYVDVSPELTAMPWHINFGNPTVNSSAATVLIDAPSNQTSGTPADYHYVVDSDSIDIGTLRIGLADIGTLEITGGAGNDTLDILGDPNTPVNIFYDGGAGDNSFTALDEQDTATEAWLVRPDVVLNLSRYSVNLANVQNSQVLGGTANNNQYVIVGDFTYPVEVDAGDSNDSFIIGEDTSPAKFESLMRIDGGAGNDTFTVDNVTNANILATNSVTIVGGTGSNTLTVNDQVRGTNASRYDIYPDHIRDAQNGFAAWADFFYEEMGSVEIDMGDGMDTTQIWGTSADITGRFTLDGNGGNDSFNVHPRDMAGNPTINGALQINGGLGSDNVAIDNSASPVGEHYTIFGLLGYTFVRSQTMANVVVGGDVELLDLRAGSGDDAFDVEDFNNTATQFNIEGNAGNDTLTMSANIGNLISTFLAAANMQFDGGDGIDTYIVDNDASVGSWSYTRIGNQLTASSTAANYSLTMKPSDFENMTVIGGSSADNFYVETLGTGQSLTLDGNDGLDNFSIADQFEDTQLIDGQIIVDGGAGGGNLSLDDSANTTGAVVHIDPTTVGTIGAAPGDTFFGPGGSLEFSNLADAAGDNTIALAMGTGADTVYAGPMPNAALSISGNGPLGTVPGDALHVALGGVLNPVQRTFGGGNGEFTSDNRKNMFWSNFEALTTDYVPTPSFLVTNTLDSGLGSLRQAILSANASANAGTPDVIRFAIPGVGAHTIQPLTQLPDITDPVVIDGTTQPGYAGTPVIELDGSLAGDSDGLDISSGSTTVRGLDIHSFVGTPSGLIVLTGGGGNVIQSNYLGTNLAGNAIYPEPNQGTFGVIIFGSSNNVIGTDGDGVNDAIEGNLISGNNTAGVLIESGSLSTADSNVVAGNFIGTNAAGSSALPNGRIGVFVFSGSGNRIGTNSDGVSDAAERNLISGNAEAGISLVGGTSTLIAGNLIGTNLAGTAPLPNAAGIDVQNSNNNLIGNTAAGAGNVIANNTSNGVWISGGTGNAVLGNSIYNNGRLGIDLSASTDPANGVTPNDLGDADTGSNNLQNFPQITTALASSTQTTLGGSLQSMAHMTYHIELFASAVADPSGYGQGQIYLGSTSVTTDSTGLANFVASFAAAVPVGQFISATATDTAGNTSEFSLSVPVAASQSNVAMLRVPGTNAPFLISSPAGTTITASASASAGATPPSGLTFPFGFVTFQVSGVAAGAAVDVTLTGLDPSQIAQYYKYGPTPATHSNHWYDFLYNKTTDGDSAAGTGMQIVGGNIVLHLIDGKRGDDDLTANGVVTDIGGPVQNLPPKAVNDSASMLKNAPVTINVLANDSDSDGTLNAASVTIVANPAHGTTSINPTTGAITYTPAANYTGADSFTYKVKDNNGAYSNVATVSITVLPTGSISGTEYLDVTGNGASADDTPLSGVNVFLDTNNNGAWNTGEPTATTLANGSYTFANLPAGSYVVRQVTPTGYIRTAPATADNYTVSLAAGRVVSGDNFANAALGNPAFLTNVVYVINGVTPVSDLRGTTHEGDTVQVTFTVVAGTPAQRFTLVSYTAPGATYDATKAAQQKIFQTATGTFGPGTYTLSVSNPHSYFQVDFVSGAAIDHFGASTSNIFYSNQNRLFSADNGGTHAVLASPASLAGTVYRDTNNNGAIDTGEQPIAGITVTATAGSTTQTVVTDIRGVYKFDNLPAGTYTVTETQSSDYTDGKDTLGNKGGTASNDKFSGIVLASGAAATGYNFGEQQVQGSAVAGNQTQSTAWWNGSSGQALIKAVSGGANAKTLGNWLATNYNNLFGANAGSANNLAGKTNTQVAAFYQSLYSNTARKAETDALALALAIYVTNSSLAGTTATSYGFAVSATGLGAATTSVGVNGAAFGVDDNAVLTITELLSRINVRSQKGIVWDSNGDGSLSTAESALRNQATSLFDSLNNL